jgi:hypothetical protein
MSTPENPPTRPEGVVDVAATQAGMERVEEAVTAAESTPAAEAAPRPTTARKSTRRPAARRSTAKKSTTTKAKARPQQAAPTSQYTIKGIFVNTTDEIRANAEELSRDTLEAAVKLRDTSVETARQLAELSIDTTAKVVHQSADFYLGAVDQLPVSFFKDIAKVQVDYTLRATDAVARAGHQLLDR